MSSSAVIEQVDSQISEALTEALEALRKEYDEVKLIRDQEDAAFQTRMQAIQSIIEGTPTNIPTIGIVRSRDRASATEEPQLSISDERLNKILHYMKKHPHARQADIATDLGFNSGTVSVGLRKLQKDGQVEPGNSERGSRVWNFLRVPAHA